MDKVSNPKEQTLFRIEGKEEIKSPASQMQQSMRSSWGVLLSYELHSYSSTLLYLDNDSRQPYIHIYTSVSVICVNVSARSVQIDARICLQTQIYSTFICKALQTYKYRFFIILGLIAKSRIASYGKTIIIVLETAKLFSKHHY